MGDEKKIQISELSENDSIKEPSTEKKSIVFLIVGAVLTVIAIVLTVLSWRFTILHLNATGEEVIATVLGLIVSLSYFCIPAILCSAISIVLNSFSIKFAKKMKALKIVALILPIILIILNIIEFFII